MASPPFLHWHLLAASRCDVTDYQVLNCCFLSDCPYYCHWILTIIFQLTLLLSLSCLLCSNSCQTAAVLQQTGSSLFSRSFLHWWHWHCFFFQHHCNWSSWLLPQQPMLLHQIVNTTSLEVFHSCQRLATQQQQLPMPQPLCHTDIQLIVAIFVDNFSFGVVLPSLQG